MNRAALWALGLCALAVFGLSCGDDDDDSSGDDDAIEDDDVDDSADDDAGDDDTWPPLPSDDDDDDDIPPGPAEPFSPTERGPYAVGNAPFLWVDDARYPGSPFGGRRLLTEVWYPADPSFQPDAGYGTPREFLMGWDELVFAVFRLLGVPETEIGNFDRPTGSTRYAPLSPSGGPFPVVVFSHGNAGLRFQDYVLAEYLASHGYVVAACDHPKNAVFVTFPDGLVIYNPVATPWAYTHRMKDLSFLIDELERQNAWPDSPFYRRLDIEHVGAIGHSFGGTAVFQDTKRDRRITAAVNMASFMFPFLADDFDTPLMFMIGAEDHTMGDMEPLIRLNFAQAPAPKAFLEFFDGGHYTFTDACVLAPTLFGEGDGCGSETRLDTGEPFDFIEHDHAFEIIDTYITAFFGAYLKGQDAMLPTLRTNLFPGDIDHAFYEPTI